MQKYQRFLTRGFTPFDPLELTRETEKIVTREGPEGLERKYVGIYSAPVYGGITTGYAAGCCLRCIYCWSNWSMDFSERFAEFYIDKFFPSTVFLTPSDGRDLPPLHHMIYVWKSKLKKY